MRLRNLLVVLSLAVLGAASWSTTPAAENRLVLGTRVVPPFVVRQDDGTLAGIGIDLWRDFATDLGLELELRETDLAGMLDGLRDGSLDVAVAALTVTAERESYMDFSHPFYTSGLGIAVPHHAAGGWSMLRAVFSWKFVQALAALLLVLAAVGIAIWLLERRANPGQFGG